MIKRLVLELEEKEHYKFKARCLKEKKSMRDVLRTLLNDWIKNGK